MLRNLILIKSGVRDLSLLHLTSNALSSMLELVENVDVERIIHAFNTLSGIELDLKFSLDPQLLFESTCLKAGGVVNVTAPQPVIAKPTPTLSTPSVETAEKISRRWGAVLLAVKDQKYFALASACKNIYKVEHQGEMLVLRVSDKSSKDILDDPERSSILLKVVKQNFDNVGALQFVYDETKRSPDEIANDLKAIFPNNFRIE